MDLNIRDQIALHKYSEDLLNIKSYTNYRLVFGEKIAAPKFAKRIAGAGNLKIFDLKNKFCRVRCCGGVDLNRNFDFHWGGTYF